MHFYFTKLEMDEIAELMLQVEWEDGGGIWKKEAGISLTRILIKNGGYERAESLAEELVKNYPDDFRSYKLLIEAKYKLGKDMEVLSALDELSANKAKWGNLSDDAEIALYRAVSSCRRESPGWSDRLTELFLKYTVSDVHKEAYKLLPEKKEAFSEQLFSFFTVKNLIAEGNYREALFILDDLIENPLPFPLSRNSLLDIVRVYMLTGKALLGAEKIKNLAEQSSGQLRLELVEASARLYRYGQRYGKAAELFRKIFSSTKEPEQFDRALWYYMASMLPLEPEKLASELQHHVKQWKRPDYFSDILEELISILVARKKWDILQNLYETLDGFCTEDVTARIAFILGIVYKAEFLSAKEKTGDWKADSLFKRVISTDGGSYYRILAEVLLGAPHYVLLNHPQAEEQLNGPGDPEATALEEMVVGFFDYGLYDEAYSFVRGEMGELSSPVLCMVSEKLAEKGRIRESLSLLDFLIERDEVILTREILEAMYPKAYLKEIAEAAERESIPLPLFYALVREESYFDNKISSSAGAVGLTQLMPGTAGDMAERMNIPNPDLTDPVDNLKMGAKYLGIQLGRFGNGLYALSAYNAGPARVQGWLNTMGELPDVLFLEAIPFPETRNYVRKVLISTVAYGLLYFEMEPIEAVKLVFGSF